MTLALPARAKLNLDLEVVARRDDGFHDLRTTYQAIDLHDLLVMEKAETNTTTLTTSGLEPRPAQPMRNTVLVAHELLEKRSGRALPTAFHLHKRIPPGSGLGGASSDAAAALRGLVALHRLDPAIDLSAIAAQIGADVPFFLHGGAARAEGRGERITPIDAGATSWFAIAWPGIELSTADVYRAWDEVKGVGPNQLRRAAEKVAPQLREFAAGLGGGWQMTGSGSAFFLRCATEAEAAGATRRCSCWTAVAQSIGPTA